MYRLAVIPLKKKTNKITTTSKTAHFPSSHLLTQSMCLHPGIFICRTIEKHFMLDDTNKNVTGHFTCDNRPCSAHFGKIESSWHLLMMFFSTMNEL